MQKHNEWLIFAENDLKVAKILLSAHEIILGPIYYHTQQGAEKALKAYLIFRNSGLKRTHDLVALVNICSQFDNEFTQLLNDAADLNPYCMAGRYPDDFFIPDETTVKICLKKAEKIFNFVKVKISYK